MTIKLNHIKLSIFSSLILFFIVGISLSSFTTKKVLSPKSTVPSVAIKTLTNQTIDIQETLNKEGYTIISFWATWCKPCISELSAINDEYIDWQEETDVKVVAISIDDARSKIRIPTIVNGKDWQFEVYSDENSDLKRALNVQNVPHTFIINPEGEIVWQHTSYNPGDEAHYIEFIKEELAKQKGVDTDSEEN
ncbi:peroxiredoxin [Bernardetia litoralis DSM 6794]|uniref:Peroxiredoxin n=1 Tax=Bernardetia litoralis (strain ATCC 23117 / DSM 6794 / NBRC 15988 / NCIMB 1366 / Fx l1 / Sio-4) TaxID=880071 RepID=I4AQK2_BERLS|nr:TlpA disulfide reductase family protein [Bernardetia litoralis]AFM06237.1 peroxiredoxin [Bernardetia litoralis DSM 6794]